MAQFSRRFIFKGLEVLLRRVPKICAPPLPSRAFGALTSAQGDNIYAARNSPSWARHGARQGPMPWSSPKVQVLSSGPCFLPLELTSGPNMRQMSVNTSSPASSHTSEGEVSRIPFLPTQKEHAAKRSAIPATEKSPPQGEGRSPSPGDCGPADDSVQDTCDILLKLGFIRVDGDWFRRTGKWLTKVGFASARENVQACRRAGLSTDSIVKAFKRKKRAVGGDPVQIQQTLDFILRHDVPKQNLSAALINIGLQEFSRLAPKVEFLRSLEVDPSRLLLKGKYMWCRPVQSLENTISALSLLIGREEALQLFRDSPWLLEKSMKDLQETTNEVDRVLGPGSMRRLVQENKCFLKSAGGVVPELLRVLRSELCFTLEELRSFFRNCNGFPPSGEVETRVQLLASTLGTDNTKALLLTRPESLVSTRNVLQVFEAVSEMLKQEQAMLILKSNPSVFGRPWSTCVEPTLRLLRDHNEAMSYERVLKAGIWNDSIKPLGSRLKFLEEQGFKVVLSQAEAARAQDSTKVVTIWPLIRSKKQFRKKFPDYQGP